MIKKLFRLLAQLFLDFLVGMAVYFGLGAVCPNWNATAVVAVAMIIALIFAETIEGKIKK